MTHHARLAQATDGQRWISVISLALAAFIFNTTEFAPVGLLSAIAQSFDMNLAQTGSMLTIYAWMVSLSSLPLMLLTRHIERKALLICLFALFIASHVLSYWAWNFTVLMISRIGIACAHAIFWSITAALTLRVAPAGKATQALGLLSTGTVMALVLGIPFGRVIGELLGWRNTFLIIALLALIVALILWRYLPLMHSQNSGSWRSVPLLLKRPVLLCLFLVTILAVSAQFTAYSYIEPFALHIAAISSRHTTLVLLVFGVAGVFGSYLFGRLHNRMAKSFSSLAIGGLALCLALLLPLASHPWGFSLMPLLWGASIMGIGLSLQYLVLQHAADATDVAMSIYSGLYNVGIGAGALLGGVISVQWDLSHVGQVGAVLAIFAALLMYYTSRRSEFLTAPSQQNK
jgi:DHA1 family L-arabinose/isopropyl-beta-D-thiogalactopyranoside export protein-like MFS transporter